MNPAFRSTCIKTLDALRESELELAAFLARDDVSSSVYHNPAHIAAIAQGLPNLVNWGVVTFHDTDGLAVVMPYYVIAINLPIRFGILNLYRVRTRTLKLFGDAVAHRSTLDPQALQRLILDNLAGIADQYDLINLEAIAEADAMFGSLPALRDERFEYASAVAHAEPVYLLESLGSWDAYLNSMKKKRRYNLKRNVQQLQEAFGETNVVMRRYETPTDVDAFLIALDQVFSKTWQADKFGYKPRNDDVERMRETAMATLGSLFCHVLFVEDKPVAFVRGYLYKGCYLFEEIGYDKAWSDHSVGSVLTFLMLEDLMKSGRDFKVLNFGYGDNVYKQVFGTTSYPANNMYLLQKGSALSRMFKVNRLLNRCYLWLRSILVKFNLDAKVRKLMKR